MTTEEEKADKIRKLRQDARDKAASQTSVQYLLQIAEHNALVVFIMAVIMAATIVTVALYVYNVLHLFYNSIYSFNTEGLLNFVTSSIILLATMFIVKSKGVDRYIQKRILDTLFVMRSDAILKKLPGFTESFVLDEEVALAAGIWPPQFVQRWLHKFVVDFVPTTSYYTEPVKGDSDRDSAADSESEEDIGLPETSKKASFVASPKKKMYQKFTGLWGGDKVRCNLYQFDVKEEVQETAFATLQKVAKWFPEPNLWVEKAVFVSQFNEQFKVEETSEDHIYFLQMDLITLDKLPENVMRRHKISKETLSYMKLFAEHVADRHEQGLFGSLSLSTAYYITKDWTGWVATFSPEWVHAEPLSEEQKDKLKKNEVMQFGAIMLEFLYNINQQKINNLKNKAVVYLSNIQPEEVLALSEQLYMNENLSNLLVSMFGFADRRPNMVHVAQVLKQCYEERESAGRGKTDKK